MKPKKYLKSGMKLAAGSIAIGAIPSMGYAGVESIKGNVGSGLANMSAVYPSVGGMMGAGMVLKSANLLIRKTKKLK